MYKFVCYLAIDKERVVLILRSLSFYIIIAATSISRAHLQFGFATGPIFFDHLACTGDEERILNCPHITGPLMCDHTADVGVQCYGIIIQYVVTTSTLINYFKW